ncbi:hypothetical protein Tsubulata_044131 [Turnera subulata]|uniref:non-specific serine/threonine protein kinase n=1 Tax=Turnera subulata TaxID=218843 RepID=A0A9Q0FHI8_9ROSI|nr:hypothetical protein Tsubulata_044131 [Turnera subulata]
MSPPPHCFLSILFLFFIKSHGDNYLSPSSPTICPSHECGTIPIKYPFWSKDNLVSNQTFCGYPDFGLTCSNGKAILELPRDSYYVEDINYKDQTITLVDIDVTTQRNCPRARHNLSIDNLPLDYNSDLDVNISFYFNCSSSLSFGSIVGCLGSSDKLLQSYVALLVDGLDISNWFGICQEKVVVTVMKTNIPSSDDLTSGFAAAMNSGFVLDWRVLQDCRECEASQGYCGYSNLSKNVFCICTDSIQAHNCGSSGMSLTVIYSFIPD